MHRTDAIAVFLVVVMALFVVISSLLIVIPAQAGIQCYQVLSFPRSMLFLLPLLFSRPCHFYVLCCHSCCLCCYFHFSCHFRISHSRSLCCYSRAFFATLTLSSSFPRRRESRNKKS